MKLGSQCRQGIKTKLMPLTIIDIRQTNTSMSLGMPV